MRDLGNLPKFSRRVFAAYWWTYAVVGIVGALAVAYGAYHRYP